MGREWFKNQQVIFWWLIQFRNQDFTQSRISGSGSSSCTHSCRIVSLGGSTEIFGPPPPVFVVFLLLSSPPLPLPPPSIFPLIYCVAFCHDVTRCIRLCLWYSNHRCLIYFLHSINFLTSFSADHTNVMLMARCCVRLSVVCNDCIVAKLTG